MRTASPFSLGTLRARRNSREPAFDSFPAWSTARSVTISKLRRSCTSVLVPSEVNRGAKQTPDRKHKALEQASWQPSQRLPTPLGCLSSLVVFTLFGRTSERRNRDKWPSTKRYFTQKKGGGRTWVQMHTTRLYQSPQQAPTFDSQ
jgi:hypothetical protein